MDIFYPIQQFANLIIYDALSLQKGSHLADSINFFLYDSIKIIALLLVINCLMAVIRYYLPVEIIRRILTSRSW